MRIYFIHFQKLKVWVYETATKFSPGQFWFWQAEQSGNFYAKSLDKGGRWEVETESFPRPLAWRSQTAKNVSVSRWTRSWGTPVKPLPRQGIGLSPRTMKTRAQKAATWDSCEGGKAFEALYFSFLVVCGRGEIDWLIFLSNACLLLINSKVLGMHD